MVHYVLSMGCLSSIHTNLCVQSLHIKFGHYTESCGHVQISAVMGTNCMDVVVCVALIFLAAVLCHGNKGLARRLKSGTEDWTVGGFLVHQKVYHSVGLYEPRYNYVTGAYIKNEQATSSDDHA